MKVDIYKSIRTGKFLFVRAGASPQGLQLPATDGKDMEQVALFKANVETQPQYGRAGSGLQNVDAEIRAKGWALRAAGARVA